MSDLIDRQEAIVTAVRAAVDWHKLANPQYSIAYCIGEAIRQLPSVQPTQSNDPNTLNTLDTIYRQAAIDALIEWYGCKPNDIEAFGKIIEALPSAQPEQGWIPVSERLPEEYEYVLLCDREPEPDENTDYSQMAVGWLEDGQICCWDDRATRNEFVAWMPLPEPYKEGK